MGTARHGRDDHLLAALRGVAEGLEQLLAFLRSAEGLRARTSHPPPLLLGGLEASAHRLRDHDRVRAAETALIGDAATGPEVAGAADALWTLLAEIDAVADRITIAARAPVAVGSTCGPDAEAARSLLVDVLTQGLEELVPTALRDYLDSVRPTRPSQETRAQSASRRTLCARRL